MADSSSLRAGIARLAGIVPGLALSCLLGGAAWFSSEHYGLPVMLIALVLGMVVNFMVSPAGPASRGVSFASRDILRFGIILLGAGISFDLLRDLGPDMLLFIALAVVLTIMFGALAGRLLGGTADFSILTGGATAICGASAALAISAVLPRTERTDEHVSFTILAVTILSTLAMILYPALAGSLGLSDREAGIFIGASIHDVAQVVGAGFTVSEEAGQVATLVKLTRVVMLAPVVLAIALAFRLLSRTAQHQNGARPPLFPFFVVGFLALACLNSLGLIPALLSDLLDDTSRAFLIVSIAAVGIKTPIRSVMSMGGPAIGLVLMETLFLACFVLAGILLTA